MDSFDATFDNIGITTENIEDTEKKLNKECEEAGIDTYMKDEEQHKIFYKITGADRDQAVYEFVIPKAYRNATFDAKMIKENLKYMFSRERRKIINFSGYMETCNGILSAIRMKKLPTRSYIIGAPNGFGKTSFVTECLITLRHHGFVVAPFISLRELADIRAESEKRLMTPFRAFKESSEFDSNRDVYYTEPNVTVGYIKKPEIIVGRYSFSEYINADCLFVSLSDITSKDIETRVLYQLLSIRGAKGLPTIVLTSQSIDPYFKDKKLKTIYWDEMIAHSEREYCYDRLLHVSTYKSDKYSKLDDKSTVDLDTGIVE